ncbi:Eukaryotic translation initiation factor 5B [Orchesella cincta]|uniref:Eukaryotic translation initiation factor 5B n=1 Tax=Orchesella cincta TaxID=48709 RepID=A0A1D2NFA5_ORCCI|nr:Eukaryotic translation initiation factor 5B [Orchesella cincta]
MTNGDETTETGDQETQNGENKGTEKRELSAAQKKREKLKLKKKLAKEAADGDGDVPEAGDDDAAAGGTAPKKADEGESSKTKKPAAAAKEKDKKDAKGKTKGPSKAQIAAIQAAIQKAKEEEERFLQEEEEKDRQREAAEDERLAKLKEDEERRERKKLKEKERKAKLKAEGKLLTAKQRQDRQRSQQMLEALKAQGACIPGVTGEENKKPKPLRGKKAQQQKSIEEESAKNDENSQNDAPNAEGATEGGEVVEEEKKEEEKIKDTWDESESEGEEESKQDSVENEKSKGDEEDNQTGEISDADSDEKSDESDSEEAEADKADDGHPEVRKKEEPSVRIQKRRVENMKNKSLDNLRSPVVCVLGHVDTGKTKILDKLRRTHVQDGEAGGITQQIGATNVPIDAIKEAAKFVKGFTELAVRVPGLLLIDTPGHESFSNLRSRGSSVCDIAILVVDIMHGLEPQTLESIKLLKDKNTPFIVALNKIDRIYDWQPNAKRDVRDDVKGQSKLAMNEFTKRTNEIIVQFAEQSLNVALFYKNPDPNEYMSMVPTSAATGEGMGNLMALIVEYSQSMLTKRLMYSNELQATVLEVKAIPGLGTTIDIILVNGALREGDTLILAGTDGPIVTQIRSLLTPQPMKELRVKNTYIEYKEIKGAIGVKVAAKDLEKAIAGLNCAVAYQPDEVEICRAEVAQELKSALSSIRLQERGVFVQASTLGSLEALLEFLRTSSIPYSGIRIGPVVKRDVMKASVMLEHDSQYAVILAFDVKIERDAQEMADHLGVKIFHADIIYHLFDQFMAYRDEIKAKKREEYKHIAVFPCKLKILPQFVFNTRDPILVGVSIEAGTVCIGTPLCVPAKGFVEIGKVTSIELNQKQVEKATKGQEVSVKIEPIPGESPKMLGRHFEETDLMISKISRESIDACKEYFRNELQKGDWQLMVELKKLFQIM